MMKNILKTEEAGLAANACAR